MSHLGKERRPDIAETVVGKLVQFETRGKGGTDARENRTTEAEILIFTGVRYEREAGTTTTTTPTKPTASSSGGKRKRG